MQGSLCRRTRVQTRCTCSRCRRGDSLTPLWRCCVKLKGNVVPLKWPQDARSYSSYRRWWWRTHLSLPEAVTHGATITTFHISEQRRCLVSKPDLIRWSVARLSVSVRLLYVRGLQTRSPARSCCCAASCLNTLAPLSLCFRFPLPAHDCLTIGGNGS